ncbi:hypothetical protein IQ238_00065 [Pleurocapsales cyanobacterium LEGE 06147]|nr:hypothetical protein [Pleurocapsales cyanobacterium LEGE 06147]
MKSSKQNYCLPPTKQEEQKLYDYLLQCTQTEAPAKVIERFRHLFIRGTSNEDPSLRLALEKIVSSPNAEQEFKFFLSRCCHIIIDHWQLQPYLQEEIPELIAQFEYASPPAGAHSRTSRKIRQLVQDFTKSEQYIKLRRLSQLLEKEQNNNTSKCLGDLIQHYPFLHQHCLLSDNSSYEFKRSVKRIQKKFQRRYELDLSRYVTYRVRLVQTVRSYKAANQTKIPKEAIKSVSNPTLLSDRELDLAIKQYFGKVEKGYSYRDLSQNFLNNLARSTSYKSFKNDLYEYLILSIDSQSDRYQFNQKLYRYLQDILVDYHSQQLNEFLLIRTCTQLFQFLVDSQINLDNDLLINLITHLGETKLIGLLLKIALLCSKTKPYLEKKFCILFARYETSTQEEVPWLIKTLENWQIASSIHFGSVDLSLLKII